VLLSHCSAAQLPASDRGFSVVEKASLRVRPWSAEFMLEPPDPVGTPNSKFLSKVMFPEPSIPAWPPENSESEALAI